VCAFRLLERTGASARRRQANAFVNSRQWHIEAFAGRPDDRPLDQVLKLTDVAELSAQTFCTNILLHKHSALFRASSRQPLGNGWKAAALIANRF
jgi:hypothetical protein